MKYINALHTCVQLVKLILPVSLLIQGSCGFPRVRWENEHTFIYQRDDAGIEVSNGSVLAKRTDVWSDSVRAGAQLNALMRNPRAEQSPWTDFADIKKYGWRLAAEDQSPNQDEITSAQSCLERLHLPALTDKSWKVIQWEHSEDSEVEGKRYPATNAEFRALYNPKHNTLIATSNTSPPHSTNLSPLVPLRHWSDLTFLTWTQLCKNPNTLKHIIRLNIINPEAIEVLGKVAGTSMEEYNKPFPGDRIETPESANAVVGFPLGRSVAYLLIQHKEAFGRTRAIKDVRFWDSYDGGEKPRLAGLRAIPNMIYTLS